MKRLIFIVEGDTEKSFVDNVLSPYFCNLNINNSVQCFTIKNTHGGISKYSDIKKDILNTLYESDVIVTTMIDFYRLPSDFPGFRQLDKNSPHKDQVDKLEQEMKKDIETIQKQKFDNFIPYIQLHEFEALVFSSINGIDNLFERNEIDYRGLQQVFKEYTNPEDINKGPNTAPSVRLKKLINGYNKVIYGIEILKEIGMPTILSHCPRFNTWIENLIKAIK